MRDIRWDQLTPGRGIDQMLRPIADAPCIRASPLRRPDDAGCYLLRRGCAMKSRDTASTCSLFAWWLLMVLEYISGKAAFSTIRLALTRYPPLLAPTYSRRYCSAAASTERERERRVDATLEGEGTEDERMYGNYERGARERPPRVLRLKMNSVPWNKPRKTTRICVLGERKSSSS